VKDKARKREILLHDVDQIEGMRSQKAAQNNNIVKLQKIMTIRNYYRFSLLVPFVVPVIFWLFTSLPDYVNDYFPLNIVIIAGRISIFAVMYGGIPYLILAGCMLIYISKKSERQIHKFFYFLPLLLLPVFFVFSILFFAIMEGTWQLWELWLVKGALSFTSVFGFWILAVGYSYIAIIQGMYWLLKRKDFFKLKAT